MDIYDRTPYTYLIGWTHLNKWYYGVRYAKNCHPSDLWVKYFTSSKFVKRLRRKCGEPDIVEVRRTFSSYDKAISWEEKVLKRLKIFEKQDVWLNRNIAGAFDPIVSSATNKGRKRSPEAIRMAIETRRENNPGPSKLKGRKNSKISESLKGRPSPNKGKKYGPAPKERVEKMLESRKLYYQMGNVGPNRGKSMCDEQKIKISNSSKGHKKPSSFSEKLSSIAKTRYKITKDDGTWTWGYRPLSEE